MVKDNLKQKTDTKDSYLRQLDEDVLCILLKDRSSDKNIIWATDSYSSMGNGYYSNQEINIKDVNGLSESIIKSRMEKSKDVQHQRTKVKAEVFTPSWVCNKQNNLVDNAWFGYEGAFNTETKQAWITNKDKIKFPEGKTWKDYVKSNRLEITCGEAPYLASRYDTTTGKWIDIDKRIGLLDRKLRVVNENTTTEKEWYENILISYKSTYGYEWQGDNLFIARRNLIYTFIDYYIYRFKDFPSKEYLINVAIIISWNIWQMDGLKCVIPNSCIHTNNTQFPILKNPNNDELCPACKKGNKFKHIGIYCKIMNWQINKEIIFDNLLHK